MEAEKSKLCPDFKIAPKFINEYVEYCINLTPTSVDTTWIDRNSLLTDNFKMRYHFILDSAFKAEPEIGLDFDPILDAQDFDDKGFEILKTDSLSGYVIVQGKEAHQFTLVMKVICKNKITLVDGCGIINIPRF